ncbi:unnamed protein product [Pocillopora meandrina]|uniref:Transposase n=1 Tax=Pocillopora meandrina TaxID=46732 RepID=A0AAU9XXZ5_9CNID|nr:unnamed protein product [Pocillopora meandrina]
MASKRKFCEHCEEYVTLRTHRLHADLYCHKTSEEVYSSEEEEIAGDDFEDVNVDRNMEHEAEDQGIEATSQGTNVQDLEEEDAVLVHDILLPESDADMLYHERVGPELTRQVWNLADEDINGDFPIIPEQYPSVYVNPAQGLQDSFNCIIRWILLVLCLWSSFSVISDNAMEILLEFLRAVFDSLATVVPGIGSFAALFPKSLHLLKKQLGIDQDNFIKYVVCPKCDTLYNFDDCYELQNRKRVLKKCTFIEFPNHRQEEAQEILNQTSAGDRASLEQQFGTRFSELMSLPHFDCVRFHIIDPMHNLFTGTAKHVMKNIWLDGENPLIKKNDLINIQEKLDKIKAPSDVGKIPRKILNSYRGFTADQWKTFTTLFSIYALSDILPKPHLELWRQFVLACSFICSPVISETRALLTHSYLLNFCKGFEQFKENIDSSNFIMTSMLSIGNVCKDVTWSAEDSSYVCCGPHHRDCLGDEFLPYLKKCYTSIFDDVDEESITGHFKRFALCTFSGDKYGSSLS